MSISKYNKLKALYSKGFTIVELLIVIVVIGILAAITIVAYNGIQTRATKTSVQSDLLQGAKQLALDYNLSGNYPNTLAQANNGQGLKTSAGTTFDYEANNATSPPSFCLTASNAALPKTYSVAPSGTVKEGTCDGLIGSYYSNETLSGTPVNVQVDAPVYFDWGTGSPAANMPSDNFSVHWQGYITAPVSGDYTFYVTSDDGQRLYLNNTMIIDDWVLHGPTTRTVIETLTAGQKYPIAYEMFEQGGGAVAKLEWAIPGGTQTPIPGGALTKS